MHTVSHAFSAQTSGAVCRHPATGWGCVACAAFVLAFAPGCHRQPAQPAAAQSEAEPEDHVAIGQAYYREGDAARAVAEFSQAIAADPRAVNVYLERASAYLRLGRIQAAFADFDKAIELEPENPERYLSRAVAHQVQRRLDAALADCNRAIALDPQQGGPYSLRAALEIDLARYDEAIADCDEALRINPQFAAAFNNRGLAWLKKKDYERAIADSTQGIEFHGETPEALVNRGVAYRAIGEEDKALADWTAAIRVAPNHHASYYNRAELYRKRGEWDKAIADYSFLLAPRLDQLQAEGTSGFKLGQAKGPSETAQQTARLLVQRAAACFGRGDPAGLKQAVADCSLSIQLNPADADAYLVRGSANRALGEAAQADADLARARRLGGK